MLLGGTANWPLAARAQQPATLSIIGFAGGDTPEQWAILLRAFRLGLKATGFIEGQNVAIEYRWTEGRNDKLPALTADLVSRQVTVIVAPTTPSALAAKAATKTIPIVFFTAGDPIDLGLVTSLSRPDSNLTGATTLTLEVGQKWVQLLHEMVPKCHFIGPANQSDESKSCQGPIERLTNCGSQSWAAASCAGSQRRSGLRQRLRKRDSTAGEWACD